MCVSRFIIASFFLTSVIVAPQPTLQKIKECFSRDNSIVCLKEQALDYVNETMYSSQPFSIYGLVDIVRDASYVFNESEEDFPEDATKRSLALNDVLYNKVEDFFKSRSVRFNLGNMLEGLNLPEVDPSTKLKYSQQFSLHQKPKTHKIFAIIKKKQMPKKSVLNVHHKFDTGLKHSGAILSYWRKIGGGGGGGGGGGKKGGMMLMGGLAMAGLIGQLMMGKIAFMAGAALLVAKMALMLSVIIGLKKLNSGGGGKETSHVVYATSNDGGGGYGHGHGGWHRSLSYEGDPQHMAYNAYAPPTTDNDNVY